MPAAQSVAVLHFVVQAPAEHRYGAQSCVAGLSVTHLAVVMLHVCANVSTVPLHDAGLHWLFAVQPPHMPAWHASPLPHGVPSASAV